MIKHKFNTQLFSFLIFVLILSFSSNIQSQNKFSGFKKINLQSSNLFKKNEITPDMTTVLLAWPLNPILSSENNKIYFGFTKEISVGFNLINYSKIGIEYSYIFRNENRHHLSTFYEFEIPFGGSEFVIITGGLGGGYLTNFTKKGIFPQVSLNMIIPVTENITLNGYEKLRHTFMTGNNETDVTEFSVGFAFGIYF